MDSLDYIEVAKDLIKKAKFDQAEISLRAIPDYEENAEVQQLLGVVAFQLDRTVEAITYFQKSARDLTDDGYLQNNLAHAYKSVGNLEAAKEAFYKAAKLQIDFADPLNQLGLLFKEEGSPEKAENFFIEAIERNSDHAAAHFNLGVLLEDLNRLTEACGHYRLALQAKPNYVKAINNLGTALKELGRYKEAEHLYRKGIQISPNTVELHSSLGACLCQGGKYIEAREEFLKAAKIAPDFVVNRWNLGFLQLAMLDMDEGWSNYRYRHTVDRKQFPFPSAALPKDLGGQVIGIAAEQGLGDQIFFSRFLPELMDRGASVVFQPDPQLKSLLSRVEEITVGDTEDPDFSVADLPYLLESDIIVPSLKIKPLEDAKRAMQERLAEAGPSPYIGITYRAGGAGKGTLSKIAPLEEIASILGNIRATIINVQRAPKPNELRQISSLFGKEVFDFSDVNQKLEESLALMDLLDDYIGVSNTNMHLRIAAGRVARVLVTHPGEFRWQVDGDVSPWFPGFRLYRQSVNGSWDQGFEKLRFDIKKQYE